MIENSEQFKWNNINIKVSKATETEVFLVVMPPGDNVNLSKGKIYKLKEKNQIVIRKINNR